MFDIGMPELIVIFIVGLLVLGPKKFPEVARALGKGLGELKKTLEDVKSSVHDELGDATSDIKDTIMDAKEKMETEVREAGKTISGTMEQVKAEVTSGTEEIKEELEKPVYGTGKSSAAGAEEKK